MKSPSADRVGLVCRLVRWQAGGGDVPPSARHLRSCAGCRRYFAASDELENELRRDAAHVRQAPPAGLERSILAALEEAPPPVRRAWAPRLTYATAAAALVLIAAGFALRGAWWRGLLPAQNSEADVVALANAADAWSDRLWNSTLPAAGEFVQDNALRQELDAVYTDARSALDFLAVNFLPTPSAPPVAAPPPQPAKS